MEGASLSFVQTGVGIWLRELSGREEQAVRGTTLVDALRLLDGVLAEQPGRRAGPSMAASLTAADRDRLLAMVYLRTYGPQIRCTLRCTRCRSPFKIHFSLHDLLAFLDPDEKDLQGLERLADGSFQLQDGRHFRLPTGEDECAVFDLPPAEAEKALLQRCLIEEGDLAESAESSVQAAMETVAPLVDLVLDAYCPECGTEQSVHFDIQHYLLSALLQERRQLAVEVHRLASVYGWSLNEILDLPRSQRRALVELIESERSSYLQRLGA